MGIGINLLEGTWKDGQKPINRWTFDCPPNSTTMLHPERWRIQRGWGRRIQIAGRMYQQKGSSSLVLASTIRLNLQRHEEVLRRNSRRRHVRTRTSDKHGKVCRRCQLLPTDIKDHDIWSLQAT